VSLDLSAIGAARVRAFAPASRLLSKGLPLARKSWIEMWFSITAVRQNVCSCCV